MRTLKTFSYKDVKMIQSISNIFTGRLLGMFLLFTLCGNLPAITVKLGSPFPEGSAWDSSLKRMAASWAEITDGEVRIKIYPGGIAGGEADLIRKMRFGQLDAGVLTSFAMRTIVPETFVLSLPGILNSEAELDYVIEEFLPSFNDDYINEGFRVLAWSKSGWAYFFSKNAVTTPDEMRLEKLAISGSDSEIAENFKALGFNVVPVNINELMVSLQSGMVNALYTAPMAAVAYQWFTLAPHMMNLPMAPVLGGLVISERTWKRIPAKFHEDLKEAIEVVAQDFYRESERLNAEALRVMARYGLIKKELNEEEKADWYEVMREGHKLVVGEDKWIDNDTYEEFISVLEVFNK